MRAMIAVLILAAVAGVLFIAYGVLTTSSDVRVSIAPLPPEELAQSTAPQETDAPDAVLLQRLRGIFDGYGKMVQSLPEQAKPTMTMLVNLMAEGKIPALYPQTPAPAKGTATLLPIGFDPVSTLEVPNSKAALDCAAIPGKPKTTFANYSTVTGANGVTQYVCAKEPCPAQEFAHVLMGDAGDNPISCKPWLKDLPEDRIIVAGPGKDQITVSEGNVIVNAGTGDDVLMLGPGRKIIVLDKDWGEDKISIDCEKAATPDGSFTQDPAAPWTGAFRNIVVLGNGIEPEALRWDGMSLVDQATDSRAEFDDTCFQVFSATGKPVPQPPRAP